MRLRVALWQKLAYPLIAVVMAVLAIPFALSMGRRGSLTGIAVAIAVALAYWVIDGLLAPWATSITCRLRWRRGVPTCCLDWPQGTSCCGPQPSVLDLLRVELRFRTDPQTRTIRICFATWLPSSVTCAATGGDSLGHALLHCDHGVWVLFPLVLEKAVDGLEHGITRNKVLVLRDCWF